MQNKPKQEQPQAKKRDWNPSLVSGVTKDNWPVLGGAFIHDKGCGHVLALAPLKNQHGEFNATVAQWGAWRHYMKARGIPTAFMDSVAKSLNGDGFPNKVWTAPAEWPHLFDSDATVQEDHEEGEVFRRGYRPEKRHLADAATRQATVAANRLRIPFEPKLLRGTYTPEAPAKPTLIDRDRLLANHAIDSTPKSKQPMKEDW